MSAILGVELLIALEIQIPLQISEGYYKPKLWPYAEDLRAEAADAVAGAAVQPMSL